MVVDALGEIVFVNKSWSTFGNNNSGLVENDWRGLNYVDVCDKASASGGTFDGFLYEEWRRCLNLKKPITLAIVDLDHFKVLNDTYGHQVGDECLIKVAGVLKDFAGRSSDICARYGGEEFALVWGDTSLYQVEKLCSRLLEKIASLKIQNCNSPTENYLTASIGLATVVPNMGSEESELIRKADNMLYRAKGCGRNRIECEYDD